MNEVEEFVKELPDGLVTLKGNSLEMNDANKMPVLESYIDKAKVDFISIKRDPSKIIFSFETDSSLDAEEALKKSVEILMEKYSEFGKLLKELK